MDHLAAITTLLGNKELECLTYWVDLARECKTQHFAWGVKLRGELLGFENVQKTIPFSVFTNHHTSLEALANRGFVVFRKAGDNYSVPDVSLLVLMPAAFIRVDHERKALH